MDYLIREMKKKDIRQVQDVAKQSWNATYTGIIPLDIQDRFLNAAYSNRNMKWRLKKSNFFVAEVDREIVGFANYSSVLKDGKVELAAIYLYPEYQGRGIGTAFLRVGIDKLGAREIHLNVEKNNQIGTTFYQAKGFKVLSEFDDNFDGHTLKTLRMAWKVKETSQM